MKRVSHIQAGGKKRSTKFIQNGNFLAQESKREDDCLTYTFNLFNNLIIPYNPRYSKIMVEKPMF